MDDKFRHNIVKGPLEITSRKHGLTVENLSVYIIIDDKN